MTEDELKALETEFNVRLPREYRQAMLHFSVPEFHGNKHTYFWNNAKALKQLNLLVRRGGVKAWPANMFAIGKADGDDVVSAIDVGSPDTSVFTFRWGQAAQSTRHLLEPKFDEFVRKYVAYAPELLREVGPSRRGSRPPASQPTVGPSYEVGGASRRDRVLTWVFLAAAAALVVTLWVMFRGR